MFAFTSDIAARSGNSSPAIASSSSFESFTYCGWSAISPLLRVGLGDRRVLRGACIRHRAVGKDVERKSRVDRRGDVRVDQRHHGTLGKRLARDLLELFAGQSVVLGL